MKEDLELILKMLDPMKCSRPADCECDYHRATAALVATLDEEKAAPKDALNPFVVVDESTESYEASAALLDMRRPQ